MKSKPNGGFGPHIFMKYLLMLAIMLGGCQISKPRAKKKLDCIVNLYPELIERDTVTILDTIVTEKKVVVPEYRDSFIIERDTIIETKEVIIEKKGSKYRLIVKTDTLTVRDTIPFKVEVPGKIVKLDPTGKDYVGWVLIGALAAFVFLVLIGLLLAVFLVSR